MSKSKRSNKAAEGSMSATITWSNGKEAFSAQDIYVTVQGESFSILGSTYVDDDTD